MNRRGFLKAILAAGVAPAVVGSGVLMPIRALATPTLAETITYGGLEIEWDAEVSRPTLSEIITAVFRANAPQIAANVYANNAFLARLTGKA